MNLTIANLNRVGGMKLYSSNNVKGATIIIDGQRRNCFNYQIRQIIDFAQGQGYRISYGVYLARFGERMMVLNKSRPIQEEPKEEEPKEGMSREQIEAWYLANGFTRDGKGYKGRNGHTYRQNRKGHWSSSKKTW